MRRVALQHRTAPRIPSRCALPSTACRSQASDVYWLAPQLRGAPLALQNPGAVATVARQVFEACRHATGEEAEQALDRGLEGVRLLHTTYAEQLQVREWPSSLSSVVCPVLCVPGSISLAGWCCSLRAACSLVTCCR